VTSVRESRNRGTLRERVSEWINAHTQMVICGHTHRPKFAADGAIPSFDTGSGIFNGYLTGLEILNGAIAPIKWLRPNHDQPERWMLAPPRKLSLVA
jgi:hypothetical protein